MAKLFYERSLPSKTLLRKQLDVKKIVIIYDRKLSKYSFVKSWLEKFEDAIPVTAGEKLKEISSFEKYSRRVIKMTEGYGRNEVALVALGGGSVGDFVGFMASVIRRGLVYANIPSTWLAAIDSAHGGKNALNLSGAKNQIGTFYEANMIWMSRRLLEGSGRKSAEHAMGEVIKIILLAGGPVYKHLSMNIKLHTFSHWKALPLLVNAKMKIVKKDFREEKGQRKLLNLGHTLGHIIEAVHGVPHGLAVLMGVDFAVRWSARKPSQARVVNPNLRMQMLKLLETQSFKTPKLTRNQIEKRFLKDKKSKNKKVDFVFIKSPGRPFIRPVTLSQFLAECQRQGILRS